MPGLKYDGGVEMLDKIRIVENHPIPGVSYYDISSITTDFNLFNKVIVNLVMTYNAFTGKPTTICAIDARGFIFGAALAVKTRSPLLLARKPGKLPGEIVSKEYCLEYGNSTICIVKEDIPKGDVVIIDDLIATGGTIRAVKELLEENGANPIFALSVITLPSLGFRKSLLGFPVHSLYEVEE